MVTPVIEYETGKAIKMGKHLKYEDRNLESSSELEMPLLRTHL
jgi:hypothetical protein